MFCTSNIIEHLTKEDILKRYTRAELLSKYLQVKNSGHVLCHFHKEKTPSMFVDLKTGYYKCYGCGKAGDVFSYLMHKYHHSFNEVLRVIATDLKLSYINDSQVTIINDVKSYKNIRIKSKPFGEEELQYWQSYGISKLTLNKYNVKAVEYYWVSDNRFEPVDMCFAYCFNNYQYKIYRPFADRARRFVCNTNVFQGYDQLVDSGDHLFITSSMKDVMCLSELGYNAIAPHSEVSYINKLLCEELMARFNNNLIVYFNNDKAGIMGSQMLSEKYNMVTMFNPDGEPKDPSDYYKKYNKEMLKELITEHTLWLI